MSQEENKALVKRYIDGLNNKNSAIEALFASDFVSHGPYGQTAGIEEHRQKFREHLDYPEFLYSITKMVAEGDEVAVILDDRHTEVTGQRMRNSGVHIYHITDGKFRELWWFWPEDLPVE